MKSTEKSDRRVTVIDPDHPINTRWAVELFKKFRDELGAVHLGVAEAMAKQGHVILCTQDGQNLGALVTKPEIKADARIFPIIAAAVPYDLQRLHVGLSMLHAIASVHRLTEDRVFQAICRQDLPSNRFWAAAGFEPICVRHTSSVRGVPCIIWRRRVDGVGGDFGLYVEGLRPRMGGGRYVPTDRPDLANIYDYSTEGIEASLRCTDARPLTPRWSAVKWERPMVGRPPAIVRPDRPADIQGRLFPTPERPMVLDGR